MYLVVSRINGVISMKITNLLLEVTLGAAIYVIGLFITKAPIIGQAKALLKKEENS